MRGVINRGGGGGTRIFDLSGNQISSVGVLTEALYVWREPNRERFSHPMHFECLKINFFGLLTNASLQVRCIFYLHRTQS